MHQYWKRIKDENLYDGHDLCGEQTNMIKNRLWKKIKCTMMDNGNKKQRWPTLIWMHHKSVCGQQTNKDNAEQVFEMRWGGWQTWSCQFVKRSCKRHFFFTFFTSWRWCSWMLMTQVLARVTSHIFQKLYFAIFQKRVGMRTKFWKILVLAKRLMLVKNCCFQPSFRYTIKIHNKLWYPLTISNSCALFYY